MPEIKDPREVEDFAMNYDNDSIRISIKGGYQTSFRYIQSPTANCQLASAYNFQMMMPFLNKYKIRDLFIKIKKSNYLIKRILLLDLNQKHAELVVSWLAPASIIGNMPYISSNGSRMSILLIRLSNLRQLQLPK